MKLKDSGKRRTFAHGAVRDIVEGKGRFDLLPFEGIEALAKVFEAGAKKYGDRNWEKGVPLSSLLDSGLRHGFKFLAGYDDEDHLALAGWNFLAALTMRSRYQGDEAIVDLPPKPAPRRGVSKRRGK